MENKIVQDRHVWLSSGHTNVVGKDRGAYGNGLYEGDLTVEFRDMVCSHLDDMGIKYTINNNAHALSETVATFKNLVRSPDLVIDIHFNSASAKATGCEVFVPNIPTDLELDLAQKTAVTISETLGIPLRGNHDGRKGVKTERESHHQKLGWMRLTGHNILLEICFISNPNDVAKYQKHKKELAHKIACDIFEFITKSDNYKSKSDKGTVYKVVSGDSLTKIAMKFNVTISHLKNKNSLNSDTIFVGQILKI